ncbi:2,5-dioxovalerate dehydrogenase [Lampropedia cohaerens]|uniref:2,5-dioxovalerate dehydrogenase n=1 Tax=Lampropedia cohaerens TaxID=1610491 RepID=A0A0U1PZ30_9BURK|nr:aldehyde dehydrogenase (NADP(+)) [Lampropedia cohaerens]KKW67770.1 2,5-dioxovalerate dehydrogenase [Lampropedia cohaerens]
MLVLGEMIIGQRCVKGADGVQKAFNPATNAEIEPAFGQGGQAEVEAACALAGAALDDYRSRDLQERAAFLECIADEILALGDTLLERAHAETALPMARLTGERGRTVGQLRQFAQVVRSGRFATPVIDPAQPERQPPRSDLRLAKTAIGPVAVFGASNFPLAFSVAGGDTASALAAGCPVIVKGHSAHLGTSELVGRAIQTAVRKCGMPEGVFSLLFGAGSAIGAALVAHPVIKAVGFTGSRRGGMALVAAANARAEPIPVYAEMSAVNPVFLFPHALQARAEQIGAGFADSLTMGAGQFCTNPGLIVLPSGSDGERFLSAAAAALAEKPAQVMLTPGIHAAYVQGVEALAAVPGVTRLAQGQAETGPNMARAALYVTTADNYLAHEALQAEVFGPASVVVTVGNAEEFAALAERLEGQLTATLHIEDADHAAAAKLVPVLERKAGRILVNGFPTGVEVCNAMVHGGPFPATSNAAFTSVGMSAIDRFLRPVCYQDFPDALLPVLLRQDNPAHAVRLVDGQVQLP